MRLRTKRKLKKLIKTAVIVIAVMIVGRIGISYLEDSAIGDYLRDMKLNLQKLEGREEKRLENMEKVYDDYMKAEEAAASALQPQIRGLEVPGYIPGHQVVDHGYYSLSYNEDWEIADWVAYTIDLEELDTKATGRMDDFRPDPDIVTGSAELSDYRGSGFDRGHLYASASATSSRDKNSSTFLMSNMVPQNHRFNAGLWLNAENAERDAARESGIVYSVSGPVVTSDMETIGENKVGIPEACYKVMLVYDKSGRVQTIGLVCPQEYENGNLKPYLKTVNEVEKLTGIDFFPSLDDSIEEKVENTYDLTAWPKVFSR